MFNSSMVLVPAVLIFCRAPTAFGHLCFQPEQRLLAPVSAVLRDLPYLSPTPLECLPTDTNNVKYESKDLSMG